MITDAIEALCAATVALAEALRQIDPHHPALYDLAEAERHFILGRCFLRAPGLLNDR